jgi:hypothetical protein
LQRPIELSVYPLAISAMALGAVLSENIATERILLGRV